MLQLEAWMRGVMSAVPWRLSSPLTSFWGTQRADPSCLVLGPLGAVHCFDIFHPFYHHIFFSSPFYRVLLRSKNSKSTAPLTLISMPRCVLFAARISLHHFSKLHFLFSPLWLPLSSTQTLLHQPDVCLLQPICFWLAWEWENEASVGFVFVFKTHTNSGKLGFFSWNGWKA